MSTAEGGWSELDALAAASAGGDTGAVARLLAAITPVITRYCRARVGRTGHRFTDADDIARQVCLSVLIGLPRHQDQNRSFVGFVWAVARRTVARAELGAPRNNSRQPPADRGSVGADGDQRPWIGPTATEARRLVALLDEPDREILLLRAAVGLSIAHTSQAVGVTPTAVRVGHARALARLHDALGNAPAATGSAPPVTKSRNLPSQGARLHGGAHRRGRPHQPAAEYVGAEDQLSATAVPPRRLPPL